MSSITCDSTSRYLSPISNFTVFYFHAFLNCCLNCSIHTSRCLYYTDLGTELIILRFRSTMERIPMNAKITPHFMYGSLSSLALPLSTLPNCKNCA